MADPVVWVAVLRESCGCCEETVGAAATEADAHMVAEAHLTEEATETVMPWRTHTDGTSWAAFRGGDLEVTPVPFLPATVTP